MNVDYLLLGQGISGTFLSYYLLQAGKSVLVVDQPHSWSPSRVAAGIMNPVTGRRLTTVWKAADILGFAPEAYRAIGQTLGIEACSRKDIIDFFPNPFMRESFLEKSQSNDPYVQMGTDDHPWSSYFRFEFGHGQIAPVYTAHLDLLIPAWRRYLSGRGCLLEEEVDVRDIRVTTEQVVLNNITAERVIFCEGPVGMDNPWFHRLPFSRNKGQALVLRIPELPATQIFKKNMLLVPLPEPELFWLGASYEWEFADQLPSPEFLQKGTSVLQEWLKLPFEVVDQRAGLRPATLERRPFCGLHPIHSRVGIFNGMGTKGCSLAPYFARELALHLTEGSPLTPQVDVGRFRRILSE